MEASLIIKMYLPKVIEQLENNNGTDKVFDGMDMVDAFYKGWKAATESIGSKTEK
jgi:hypothetical protein